MEDEVVREVEKAKAEWEETLSRTRELVGAIASCGKEEGMEEANSLPRLNGSAQDNLAILRSLQFKLDLRAQQMTTEDGVHSALSTLDSWKDLHHSYLGTTLLGRLENTEYLQGLEDVVTTEERKMKCAFKPEKCQSASKGQHSESCTEGGRFVMILLAGRRWWLPFGASGFKGTMLFLRENGLGLKMS